MGGVVGVCRRSEVPLGVVQVVTAHPKVVAATLFGLGDVIPVILSHFEERSPAYTIVIAVLSLGLLIVCFISYPCGQRRKETVSRFVKNLELVFAIAQCFIAWYDVFMVFYLHTTKGNKYLELDWVALAAFPVYVYFYMKHHRNSSASVGSNSELPVVSSPSGGAGQSPNSQQTQTGSANNPSATSRESGNGPDERVIMVPENSGMSERIAADQIGDIFILMQASKDHVQAPIKPRP